MTNYRIPIYPKQILQIHALRRRVTSNATTILNSCFLFFLKISLSFLKLSIRILPFFLLKKYIITKGTPIPTAT